MDPSRSQTTQDNSPALQRHIESLTNFLCLPEVTSNHYHPHFAEDLNNVLFYRLIFCFIQNDRESSMQNNNNSSSGPGSSANNNNKKTDVKAICNRKAEHLRSLLSNPGFRAIAQTKNASKIREVLKNHPYTRREEPIFSWWSHEESFVIGMMEDTHVEHKN